MVGNPAAAQAAANPAAANPAAANPVAGLVEAWTLAGEAWIPVEVAAPAAVHNFGRSMAFRFKGSDRALFRVDFRRVTVSTCSHLTSRILE